MVDSISNLPCVKNGPSVIILSRHSKTPKRLKTEKKSIALSRVFHANRDINEMQPSTPSVKSLTMLNGGTNAEVTNTYDSAATVHLETKTEVLDKNNSAVDEDDFVDSMKVIPITRYVNKTSKQTKFNRILNESKMASVTCEKTKCVDSEVKRPMKQSAQQVLPISITNTLQIPSSNLPNESLNASHTSSLSLQSNVESEEKRPSFASRVSLKLTGQKQFPVPYYNQAQGTLKKFQKIRLRIYWIVMNPWFELAVTLFIICNTICLALEYHGMDPQLKQALDVLNHVSTL